MKQGHSSIYYRIGVVVALVLVVVIIIVFKSRVPRKEMAEDVTEKLRYTKDSLVWHSLPKETVTTARVINRLAGEKVTKKTETVENTRQLSKDVLALVDGEEITLAAFDSIFNSLQLQIKDYFKDDKAGYLEDQIVRQLLKQDARRKKIQDTPEYKSAAVQNPTQTEDIMVNALIRNMVANISVTEPELKEFFDQYKDQLPNKDYELVKEQLRPMAIEEKQRLTMEQYLNELKSNAKIVRNEEWIKTQKALTADNPLNKVLKLGQPVVADFGKGTCMPCKMMEPILKNLEKKYQGRASILILDVDEYRSLSRKYRVMMIPTQVFFDSHGKEVYRHQGFMSEANIIAKLKEMGVD